VAHSAGPLRVAWPVLFLLGGCGYVGDPLPPLANIPARIVDVAAVQRGARLIVHFTAPTETAEHMPIKPPVHLDLRVGPSVTPLNNVDDWAAPARQIPEVQPKNGLATYDIPAGDWIGKPVTIAAFATGGNRKNGPWSNFVNLTVVPPPPVPANILPVAVANGVRLTWDGGPGQYRVLRRAGDAKEFTLAATVDAPEWVDTAAETGKKVEYLVQRVAPPTAESELPDPVAITPADTFPPAAPSGLRAVGGANTIELTWERNTESDLAGYRVYRAVGEGAFEKVGDTSVLPAFSDKAVEAGKTYRYQIAAFDQAGNESGRSAIVFTTL
jgi:hypothetical protein